MPSAESSEIVTTAKDRSIQEAVSRVGPAVAPDVRGVSGASGRRVGALVTAVHHLPARAARTVPFPDEVAPCLRLALASRSVQQLYTRTRRKPSPTSGRGATSSS